MRGRKKKKLCHFSVRTPVLLSGDGELFTHHPNWLSFCLSGSPGKICEKITSTYVWLFFSSLTGLTPVRDNSQTALKAADSYQRRVHWGWSLCISVFPATYHSMIQHKTLRAHDERFIIGNNLTALSHIEDSLILYLCFQFSNSRCWCGLTHTSTHMHKNRILPHKSTIKHPVSPETLRCLKIDPPQNNWDGT